MRAVTFSRWQHGINRLREKGGAQPEALYDLENGYVTLDGSLRSRPGTEEVVQLPAGTKGLCAFKGKLVVFSHQAQSIPASTPQVVCEIVIHPTAPTTPLQEIHFAAPFLGFLYVVAEFADGLVRHYWLREASGWQANKAYKLGDLVQPSTPNGFLYRAHRLNPPGIVWAPNVARAVNDRVEPTSTNGFEYVCVQTIGSNPRSGATEPTWPTTEGATVVEDTSAGVTPPPNTGSTEPPTTDPGDDIRDRYGGGRRDFPGRYRQV